VQSVIELGRFLEAELRFDEAVACYQHGLDVDMLVEPFYQGLMRCYDRLDRLSDAMSAYRRLRQTLSVTLGVPPSPASERLYRSFRTT
jgi:DNA-binding SARP family transcriptional activator